MKKEITFILLAFWVCTHVVVRAENFCKPVINWSSTISFCQGNVFTLSALNANATYIWSTGAITPSITISSSGTYWVKVTNVCGTTSDTIQAFVDQALPVNLGADRAVCSSNNPTLSAPFSPSANYRWQDNSTSHQMQVTQSGKYYVRVTNACGTYSDTVNITLHDPVNINLGPDQNYCNPGNHTLSIPTSATGVITWSTGQSTKNITVNSSGTYWVKVKNTCGTFSDTVKITFEQGKLLDIGDTIGRCNNQSINLTANVTGGSYLWSDNSTTKSIAVNTAGTYWVQFTDNCGTYTDTVYVYDKGMATVDLGNDTVICLGEQLVLDAENPGSSYVWSTGEYTRTITIDTTGTYFVTANNGCGPVSDSIYVEARFAPMDSIGDSAFYCTGGFIDVDAKDWGPNSYYYWDDGSRGRYHRYSTPGAHWVDVGNECDTLQIQFYVTNMDHKPFDLGNDTAVCGPLTLDPGLSEIRNRFKWSNGSDKGFIDVSVSGEYWVEVTNACGTFTDTIEVEVLFPPAISAPKKVICNGVPVRLRANPDTLTTYRWHTGDTTRTIFAYTAGWYKLYAYNICDTIRDSVLIKEESDINFSLGNDTVICAPDILLLNVSSFTADSLRWSTGSRNGLLPVSTTGLYWVTLYNACGAYSDTIKVDVEPEPGGKISDTAICNGASATLDAYKPFISAYSWSNGATTSSTTISTHGWHWVDLLSSCGWFRDSVFVRVDHPVPPFSLGNDTVFCRGTLWLDAGYLPGASYLWQNYTRSQKLLVNSSGTYYVTKSNSCNSYTDTIVVLITGPPVEVLGDTVRFCTGSNFTLNAQNPGSTYLWQDGSTDRTLTSDSSGLYWVTIENLCGKLTDSVYLVTDEPLDQLELGNDTTICRGDVLTLKTGYPASGIFTQWSTGSNNPQLQVSQTGEYWVSITNTCGTWTDTIYVEVLDIPVFTLGPDSVICAIDGRVDLYGPPGMETYHWSTGETSQNITATKAGIYSLEVNNGCFSFKDSIFLKEEYPLDISLGNDTVLCFGQSLFLSPANIGYTLHWNENFNGNVKEVTRSGTHWVWAKNSCGVFGDTIQVWFDLPVDAEPIDTTVCGGDSAVFDLTNKRFEVVWFDGEKDLRRSFTEEGTYSATLTNTCGAFLKNFEVNIVDCDCPLYVPSAFTPDGDGINDEFLIGYDCDLVSFEIIIFDRWGKIQFQSTDPHLKWDGQVNGKDLPMGSYHYLIDYKWEVYGEVVESRERDIINLIR